MYLQQKNSNTIFSDVFDFYYTHTDHLGSITEITNNTGTLLQRMAYNAWGKRELLVDNTGTGNYLFDRGYTGHEHLDQFALINMNGRLYDPVLGRMLSPDNYVQNVTGTQGFNRYSYALNNPMVYTDPDGEFIQYIIGGIVGGISGYMIADAYGYTGWDKFWYTLGGAGIGVATAGIGTLASAGIGTAVGSVSWAGAASYIGGGSIAGGFNSLAFAQLSGNHEKEGLGFLTGAIGGGFQGAIGGGLGAFAGGATSSMVGNYIRGERNAVNLLVTGLSSGVMSYGSYELSTSISWQSAKNEFPKNITYKEYKALLTASQRSTFYNREYSVVSENNNIHITKGNVNDVSFKVYRGTKFAYHFHEDVGYDMFSTPEDNFFDNDITNYTNATLKVGNYMNMVGTREGNIWFMNTPYDNPSKFDFNFAPYFYPFNIYKF